MPSLAALPTQAASLQKSRGTQPLDVNRRQVLLAASLDIGLFRRGSHRDETFPKTVAFGQLISMLSIF
jgi:hypothetical protein